MRVPELRLVFERSGALMASNKERAEKHPSRKGMVKGYAAPPKALEKAAAEAEKGKEVTKPALKNRAAAALQLRIDGAGWYDIAQVLEFSSAADARQAVEVALAAEPKDHESVEEIRHMESRRIERVMSSLSRRATNPKDPDHLQYARTFLMAVKQHTELHGAQAPAKVDITYNPSAKQLEEWVSGVAEALHGRTQEAEILEAEVVSDGPSDRAAVEE